VLTRQNCVEVGLSGLRFLLSWRLGGWKKLILSQIVEELTLHIRDLRLSFAQGVGEPISPAGTVASKYKTMESLKSASQRELEHTRASDVSCSLRLTQIGAVLNLKSSRKLALVGIRIDI
jgi:hypothetical protein